MTDYISREAAKTSLCDDCRNKNCPMQSGIKRSSCALYKAPTKSGYVKVEDLIKELQRQYDLFSNDYHIPHRNGIADCIEIVKDIPAADVRPVVRGKWEIDNSYAGPGLMNLRCSVCGEFGGTWKDNTLPSMLYKFCPNCGADMREPNLDTTKGDQL